MANFSCPTGDYDYSNVSLCDYFPEHCDTGDRPFVKAELGEFIVKLIFYLIVFFASCFGNIIVIVVVYLYRAKMQSSAYIYLLNLSVAGLLITLGCMWPYFMVSIAHEYPLGAWMCKLHPFLQLTSMVSSVLTLATIALDQFVAVTFPIHARFTNRLRPIYVIAAIWIISASLSVPFLIFKEHVQHQFSDYSKISCSEAWPSMAVFDPVQLICIKYEPSKTAYYTFITVALFFFPVGIMIIAYSVIMCKVWSTHVPGDQQENNVHAKSKAKIVKLVAAVLVGFFICWMPLQVLILFERYQGAMGYADGMPTWFNQFSYFAHYIAYANSAINPLIYCFLNGKFRQGFVAVLTCQRNRRKRSFQDGGVTEIALMRNDTYSRKASTRGVTFHVSNHSTAPSDDSHLHSRVSLDLDDLEELDERC